MPLSSKRALGRVHTADCVRRLLLAWLFAATLESLLLPAALRDLHGLDGLARMSFPRLLCVTALGFWALQLSASRRNALHYERAGIVLLYCVLALLSLCASFTLPFLAACVLLLVILLRYLQAGWESAPPQPQSVSHSSAVWPWLAAGAAAAFFLFVSIWTVCRVLAFSTPSYDFGIFSQMFHSMKTTGLPTTTLERDGALSHFAVHVSPIYYLMLPFYLLVPRPETLQVLQAAVLASSVLPLWLLGKRHGLSAPIRTVLCAALVAYPAFSGGTSYDLHENCFLAPLLLWLLYAVDQQSTAKTVIFAALTLLVKEDAAVYVAVVALFVLLRAALRREPSRRWELTASAAMLTGSIVWFLLVTAYLSHSGDGVMSYRYGNFLYDGSDSLFTVIKAVLLCPMKAVFECVDAEKLDFMRLTLLPLLAIPLFTRRYERYLLLIPYLLLNLMSDYRYQHDVFFQYTFGSTACLFYLFLVNLADLRRQKHALACAALAALLGLVFTANAILPVAERAPRAYLNYRSYYQQISEHLDAIPDDASVTATTYYTTYLSSRKTLYDLKYASLEHLLQSDYVVLNLNQTRSYEKFETAEGNGVANLQALLARSGYIISSRVDDSLVIYNKLD